MHIPGRIIEGFKWPISLGGGVGGALLFQMPPEHHILQYNVPFCFSGAIFWFKEIPVKHKQARGERWAYLCMEGKRKNKEISLGIPFFVENGGFTLLNRRIGIIDVHVVRQTSIF